MPEHHQTKPLRAALEKGGAQHRRTQVEQLELQLTALEDDSAHAETAKTTAPDATVIP